MSNQIVITSGAKVRNLSGVLTATSGVVDSVGFGTANGVATLDSNGKVPLSQLPASVVTYLGTWNAATNTPTLANGTGDVGDLYICNVAGTVNFGAGPITFAVGDWVIYNGSQWQKSAGSSGTVTSVAMTVPTGLSVTGSPITTSGTLAVSLSSGYTIPTTSFLAGLVPYTGATTDVDLGAHVLNAQSLHVKGTAGAGHLGLKHQSTAATGSANESLIYANVDGDLAWQNDNLYLTTLNTHANTANRVYTFPNASGTIALTSDISYPVTSVFGRTGAVTAQSGDYTTTQVTEGTNLYFTDARARGAISLTTTGTSGAATYNSTTGVLNIPNYSETTFGTVTSVGLSSATSGVTIGSSPITTSGTITLAIATASGSQQGLLSSTDWTTFNGKQTALNGIGFVKISGTTISYDNNSYLPLTGGTLFGSLTTTSEIVSLNSIVLNETGTLTNYSGNTNFTGTTNGLKFKLGGGLTGAIAFDTFGLIFTNHFGYTTYLQNTVSSNLTLTLPSTNGTLALTSQIPSLSGYVQGSGTTNYLPKFTASGTIGNSSIIDDGTIRAYTNALYVFQTGGTGAAFYMSGGGTDSALSSITSSSTYQNLNLLASTLAFYTGTLGGLSTTERMRITPAGNVGIGTTSPNTYTIAPQLVVDSGASGGGLTIKTGTTSSTTNYGGVFFADGTTGSEQYRGFIQYSHNFNSLTDTLILGTAGTEKMYITSGGNVGIGVTPSTGGLGGYSLLEIANGGTSIYSGANQTILGTNISWSGGSATYKISNYAEAYIQQSGTHQFLIAQNGTAGNPITFTTAMYIASGGNVGIGTSPSSIAKLDILLDATAVNGLQIRTSDAGSVDGSTTANVFRVVNSSAGNWANAKYNAWDHIFTTSGTTERMRITSGGNVGIASTPPSNVRLAVFGASATSSDYAFACYTNVGGNLLYIRNDGYAYVAANAWVYGSDLRLKENISDVKSGLDMVLKMKPKHYDYINGTKENIGFIAQDIQEIIPQAVSVTNEETGMLGLKTDFLVPYLVKAIQEQQAQIEELKALINK